MDTLHEFEDSWPSSIGEICPGKRVMFRGKDLFKDLQNLSWMELYLFGITGRFFSPRQVKLFDRLWALSTSYPDPRIWNNRIAALAGTARSIPALAVGAATAASDAGLYGGLPALEAAAFLQKALTSYDKLSDLEIIVFSELKMRRRIGGFGRPLARTDERIQPIMDLARELEFESGPHVQVAFKIHNILSNSRYRLELNAAGLAAALASDQGLSPEEFRVYTTCAFSTGMLACYLDAAANPEGAFFPLRVTRIKYTGPKRRTWSDKSSSDTQG